MTCRRCGVDRVLPQFGPQPPVVSRPKHKRRQQSNEEPAMEQPHEVQDDGEAQANPAMPQQ
eukprot:9258817-Alexandrium_andersonii.AAC.1